MNPKILRLTIVFLLVFVGLSYLPMLPDLGARLGSLGNVDELGNGLIIAAGGLLLLLGLVVLRRRARAKRPAQRPASRQLVVTRRASAPAPAPARRTVTAADKPSALQARLRTAARKGTPVVALARTHGLAIDAVRTAIGRDESSPAASRGSSFRPRQTSMPASPRTRTLPKTAKAYRA